jgi:hypothetical protein
MFKQGSQDNTKEGAVGVYFGTVVDISDPLKLGRIRVRTPHYVSASRTSIPWAMYGSSGNGGSANKGFYFIPNLDSQVLVAYVQGSIEHPVWIGAVPGLDADTGQADTHAAHQDESSPYGQEVEFWDETQQNSIATSSGHRFVFDDNMITQEGGSSINVRRIVLESAEGNFLRMIEAKNLNPDEDDTLLEMGTVRDDRTWIRRLAMDHELQNITLTGPDSSDDGQHEFEINSETDYMSATTSRGYKLILDDDNELIDLYTTRGAEEVANQMVFNNPNRSIDVKSYEGQTGITILDNQSGSADMYSPAAAQPSARSVDIGFKHGGSGPMAYMVNGSGMSKNGFLCHSGGGEASMWSGSTSGASTPSPSSINGHKVSVTPTLTFAGQESSSLTLNASNSKLYNSNTILLDGPTINMICSVISISASAGGGTGCSMSSDASGNMTMESNTLTMRSVGSNISHDYFNHVHVINFGNPTGAFDPTGVAATTAVVAGAGPVTGIVRTSYPGA